MLQRTISCYDDSETSGLEEVFERFDQARDILSEKRDGLNKFEFEKLLMPDSSVRSILNLKLKNVYTEILYSMV